MKDLPLVTIAIPTYNRLEYLKQALVSAQAQTYPNIEIIVSDNASSDGTQAFMENVNDSRLRYIRQNINIGMAQNIDFSLKQSSGKYFIVLSDDDLIYPELIHTSVNSLESNSDSSFWFSSTNIIDENGNLIGSLECSTKKQSSLEHIKEWLSGNNMVSFCSTVYRVEPLINIGGFQKTPVLDAISRILLIKNGSALSCGIKLASYRKHSKSDTNSLHIKVWFDLINSINELIVQQFPTQKEKLRPLLRGYAVRSLLGIVKIGDWSGFTKAITLLQLKYGIGIWLESKPYRTVLEFFFPRLLLFMRQISIKKEVAL